MKNISFGLNIFLIVAVGILYYLHFAKPSNTASKAEAVDTSSVTTPIKVELPKEIKSSKIVYINADTLYEKYEQLKEIKKEAQSKQGRLEANYSDKAQKFQQDYMEYQQKASQGQISADQAKATEEDLMKRKTEIDQLEQQQNILAEDFQKKNMVAQKDITDYLKEYNKLTNYQYILTYSNVGGSVLLADDSLDITTEIVQGLNVQYMAKKKKK